MTCVTTQIRRKLVCNANDDRFARATGLQSGQLAQQPALGAAQPELAVLGRQHRARPPCRRACAAADGDHDPLVRRVPAAVAVLLAASEARLARPTQEPAAYAVSVAGGLCLQQRDLLLGQAVYRGAERAADPVGRT